MIFTGSTYSIVSVVAVTAIIIPAMVVVYRLFFSPFTAVPGPLWAKVSPFWLWIHDLRGTAAEEIDQLHREYGSIVQIGPNEVSVSDVDIHNSVLFCQAPKFFKAPYYYVTFKTGPHNMFTAIDPHEHSFCRRLVSRAFSRKSVLEFEPAIHETVQAALSIIEQQTKAGAPVDIVKVFRSLALDFITRFTYGGSVNALQVPGLNAPLLDAFDQFATSNFLFMMCPALRIPAITILSLIPAKTFQAIPSMRKSVNAALDWHEKVAEEQKDSDDQFRPMLMSEIQAAEVQQQQLSRDFLLAEGVGGVFAGTDTTSTMLYLTFRALCMNKEIYEKLHEELKSALPNQAVTPKLIDLEAMPYLTACVKEGLRYASPVRSRLPRVCPPSGWQYKGSFFPGGTIVSSSPRLMNYNERVFPNPRSFIPERWISNDAAYLKKLEDVAAPFSKGSRSCIGRNLATAEIYITMASVARRFKPVQVIDHDLKLKETFGVVAESPVRILFEETKD
ncbi:hypothetical protein LTR67_005347 [Exophiala xenobiotica]